MISTTARQQGAVIIEQFLAKSDNGCLARAMCQYGARYVCVGSHLLIIRLVLDGSFGIALVEHSIHISSLCGGRGGSNTARPNPIPFTDPAGQI